MALVVNRQTAHVIPLANTPEYPPEHWLINPVMPDGVPYRYIKVVGDEVVEMTAEEKALVDDPPKSMAERHAREQLEGVTLANGWVMRWTDNDQLKMGLAKSAADMLAMAQNTSPLVPFYEVNGTKHLVAYTEAYQILGEYMALVMIQQARQEQELANG
jgi:hypothetical protein